MPRTPHEPTRFDNNDSSSGHARTVHDPNGANPTADLTAEMAVLHLRIVVLSVDDGGCCATCGLPTSTTVTYVLEPDGWPPSGLCRLTFCETCEGC